MKESLKEQIGGDHYKNLKIQPVVYNHANGLDFFQGNVVKYVTRHPFKNGREDLEKARHILDIYIDLEYPVEKQTATVSDSPLVRSGEENNAKINRRLEIIDILNDAEIEE